MPLGSWLLALVCFNVLSFMGFRPLSVFVFVSRMVHGSSGGHFEPAAAPGQARATISSQLRPRRRFGRQLRCFEQPSRAVKRYRVQAFVGALLKFNYELVRTRAFNAGSMLVSVLSATSMTFETHLTHNFGNTYTRSPDDDCRYSVGNRLTHIIKNDFMQSSEKMLTRDIGSNGKHDFETRPTHKNENRPTSCFSTHVARDFGNRSVHYFDNNACAFETQTSNQTRNLLMKQNVRFIVFRC